ncbi:methyltransferase family protein [Chloroflexota bacterium]
MVYIAIGILGFLILHFFDIIVLKGIRKVKLTTWIAGCALLVYSVVMMWLTSDKISLPAWSILLGWGLLLISVSFTIYSLFINLPFRKTYIDAGVGGKLVKTKLYALVRHPGVAWFALTSVALVLVSQSRLLLIASPIYVAADIVLVYISDRFVFGRMFPEYTQYRKETPMFLPNRRSIRAFKAGLKRTADK